MLLERENPDLAIVFCRTKRGAEKLAKKLHADGIECREIHGNLAQNKRDRVMKSFRSGKFDVLVATDLASRGHRRGRHQPHHQLRHPGRSRGRTSTASAAPPAWARRARRSRSSQRDQGEELTKVENLINMVIPQATLEGFEARPAARRLDRGQAERPARRPGQGAGRPLPAGLRRVRLDHEHRRRSDQRRGRRRRSGRRRAGHLAPPNDRQQDPHRPPPQTPAVMCRRTSAARTSACAATLFPGCPALPNLLLPAVSMRMTQAGIRRRRTSPPR